VGKVLYSVTMSVDGFIAGPGGDMSWLSEHLGPNPTADDVIDKIGALLVGNRTFRGDDPYKGVEAKEGKPFGGGCPGGTNVMSPERLPCPRGGAPLPRERESRAQPPITTTTQRGIVHPQ
jgi:riboflavin biosynthesis pyrimidine reductase